MLKHLRADTCRVVLRVAVTRGAKIMNDWDGLADDVQPLGPQPGELTAVLPDGLKISGPVDFMLNAACTNYVDDGRGAYAAVRQLPQITILDLFRFSGLTTAAWCEGLTIAEPTWYKYRNKQSAEIPADRMEDAWVLAMETRAAIRGLRSGAAARRLRKIMELLKDDEEL